MGQIQSGKVLFQDIHDPEGLLGVFKAQRAYLVQCPLSRVTEGSVPEIMSQSDGFGKIFIQSQSLRYRPCILRNL